MAYLHKDRELRKLTLCGNELPWVPNGKHLGMRIDSIKGNILNNFVVVNQKFMFFLGVTTKNLL